MTKEESKEDPSDLIYDLPKGYDIWNGELPETKNYSTSTKGGRHFKPPHLETNNPVEALNKFP